MFAAIWKLVVKFGPAFGIGAASGVAGTLGYQALTSTKTTEVTTIDTHKTKQVA